MASGRSSVEEQAAAGHYVDLEEDDFSKASSQDKSNDEEEFGTLINRGRHPLMKAISLMFSSFFQDLRGENDQKCNL